MLVIEANTFSGYCGLRQVESPDEDEVWAAYKIISCTPRHRCWAPGSNCGCCSIVISAWRLGRVQTT